MPSSVPARAPSSDDDLAAARGRVVGVGRGLAVHAEVARRLLDQPVGLAGHDERVLGEADVQRLAAAAQREQQVVGRGRRAGGDGHRALEARDGAAERLGQVDARRASRRDTSVGITLASVVISAAMRSPSVAFRSAKLSTSPLSAPTTYGPGGRPAPRS